MFKDKTMLWLVVALVVLLNGPSLRTRAEVAQATYGGASLPGTFNAVRSCLPFTILIQPPAANAAGSNGSVAISADQAVIGALSVYIDSAVLVLEVAQGFSSSHIVNVTVTAGSGTNLSYIQNFGTGDVAVAPGFNVPDLYVSATSTGSVYVSGLTAGRVRAVASGINTVYVNGSLSSATITASGLAKVYLEGLTGRADISADGISTVWISGSSGINIYGTADNLAKVYYTAGTCSVSSSFMNIFGTSMGIFGNPCYQGTFSMPSFAPTFSCGLNVFGQSNCPATNAPPAPLKPSIQQAPAAPAPVPAANITTTPPPPMPVPNPLVQPTPAAPIPGAPTTNMTSATGPAGNVQTTTSTSGQGGSAFSSGGVSSTGAPPLTSTSTSGGAPPAGPVPNVTGASGPEETYTVPSTFTIPVFGNALAAVSLRCEDPTPQPLW